MLRRLRFLSVVNDALFGNETSTRAVDILHADVLLSWENLRVGRAIVVNALRWVFAVQLHFELWRQALRRLVHFAISFDHHLVLLSLTVGLDLGLFLNRLK